jgi:hypothetical protein
MITTRALRGSIEEEKEQADDDDDDDEADADDDDDDDDDADDDDAEGGEAAGRGSMEKLCGGGSVCLSFGGRTLLEPQRFAMEMRIPPLILYTHMSMPHTALCFLLPSSTSSKHLDFQQYWATMKINFAQPLATKHWHLFALNSDIACLLFDKNTVQLQLKSPPDRSDRIGSDRFNSTVKEHRHHLPTYPAYPFLHSDALGS